MSSPAETETSSSSNNKKRKKQQLQPYQQPPPPPQYGSQDYWEERYRKQLKLVINNDEDNNGNSNNNKKRKGEEDEEKDTDKDTAAANKAAATSSNKSTDETLPYHSWYFSYDELRPIILPLILGGRQEVRDLIANAQTNDDDDDNHNNETTTAKTEQKQAASASTGVEEKATETTQKEEEGAVSNDKQDENALKAAGGDPDNGGEEEIVEDDDDDEFEEIQEGEYEEEEEEEIDRVGLAKDKSISVLEIGCGDVPLGAGLACELHDLEVQTGQPSKNIVQQILCTDYSPTVINMMEQQYQPQQHGRSSSSDNNNTSSNRISNAYKPVTGSKNVTANNAGKKLAQVDVGNVPLQFQSADACNLPFEDETFELILEKGTLDALLSDKVVGCDNCIQTVSECARVLKAEPHGYLVIISHLNAHTPNGIRWLEEVIFKGLTKNHNKDDAEYMIEVHGSDHIPDQDEDHEEGEEKEGEQELQVPIGASAGPAVYVIHKKKKNTQTPEVGSSTTENTGSDGKEAMVVESKDNDDKDNNDDDKQTIRVKFFTY